MTADVQQCAHLEVLTAHDEQRLSTVARGEEIARLTHLAVVPDTVPVAQNEPLHLLLEKLRIAVELTAERVAGALGADGTCPPFRQCGHQCPEPTCKLALMPMVRGR